MNWLPTLAGVILLTSSVPAQTLQGQALVKALRQGGYVIVMRHASSPAEAPDSQTANTDNIHRERQLDAKGRASATAMGQALRELKIPIGDVLSSPTYRALETVRYAKLGDHPLTFDELGDGGKSMQSVTDVQATWLQGRVTRFLAGTNTVIVTHLPNLTRAFPQYASGMADGEAMIFGSDHKGGATLVARVKIEEWAALR